MDSIPEKTLEHWSSIYLTYRFKSHCGLWWPTFGEDIAVTHGPQRPGKIVFLELKTSEFTSANWSRHSVKIRISQLKKYLKLPQWQQPYYVFPIPTWIGPADRAAMSMGQDATEGAFSRNSTVDPIGWMAEWLFVLSAREVQNWVNMKAKDATLFTVQVTKNTVPVVTWTQAKRNGKNFNQTRPVGLMGWREFWTWLCNCGGESSAQIVALPLGSNQGSLLSRQALLQQISAAQDDAQDPEYAPQESNDTPQKLQDPGRAQESDGLVYWGWTGDGYEVVDAAQGAEHDEISRSLVGVHLSLGVLAV